MSYTLDDVMAELKVLRRLEGLRAAVLEVEISALRAYYKPAPESSYDDIMFALHHCVSALEPLREEEADDCPAGTVKVGNLCVPKSAD